MTYFDLLSFKVTYLHCSSTESYPLNYGCLICQLFNSSSSKVLSVAFFSFTDQTMGVATSLIVCQAELPFCESKSCVAVGAVLLTGRHLALAHYELKSFNNASAFVIGCGTRSSPFFIHPWPSSDLRSRIALRVWLYMNALHFDFFRCWSRQSVVGGSISFFCLF